jgi:hypothetical protein
MTVKYRVIFRRPPKFISLLALLACVAAGICWLCLCVGCATEGSDMPWNTPQTWEGTRTIPGFTDR